MFESCLFFARWHETQGVPPNIPYFDFSIWMARRISSSLPSGRVIGPSIPSIFSIIDCNTVRSVFVALCVMAI